MKNKILITGSNGEIGNEVLSYLAKENNDLIALDINHSNTKFENVSYVKGSIIDEKIIDEIFSENQISEVYHFAALLSQTAAKEPKNAKKVNELGSQLLINRTQKHGFDNNMNVKFFFPSSIAVYGPRKLDNASEQDIIMPTTVYGKNKLVIEQYGTKKNIENEKVGVGIDFRVIRLPGVISPNKIPFGGTTDFAPQMIHAAIKGENFICRVSDDTSLPFISLEKAVLAIINLMRVKEFDSSYKVFNVEESHFCAKQLEVLLKKHFNSFKVDYIIDDMFQSVAETWPSSLNCDSAKKNWNFNDSKNFEQLIENELIPLTKNYYENNR